ncbi:hypothetical protein OHU45_37625 [Streptomyces tubercidicus]|uniref:hypothetical protein n=1 Tax=Streptomyces TaxID=1883 RepID=UPI0021D8770E|nr:MULTISPECIES: hypothetical protein [unclassified Streptomyces]UYB37749.1 hypothetical protein SLV14_000005 [Streptomyces sp. Je 1-4]UYB44597.1 hypothetical protein SLV14_007703 [Streptomyces sp. Je 1-4]UZQ33657.1 hypothetical protein SLV14N_000005 [Streptomyces sp. Je 1-4] [Streptomyces sp. Je 1-4 4N24]UZQ41066.1 hypothetical protein SLV14N_007703 [Streptomyces sp. Je 1-4] [Streptomyces sp. Je 1-4 4N24]UZQ41075.1 hypothetical protein SLV14NA_000005 [Streptomyces sp. Je 1-4] [Streptomyces sp
MPTRPTAVLTWPARASNAALHRSATALWLATCLRAEFASSSARRRAWIIGQLGPLPYPYDI